MPLPATSLLHGRVGAALGSNPCRALTPLDEQRLVPSDGSRAFIAITASPETAWEALFRV